MERRTLLKALVSAPVAIAASGASVSAGTPESAPRCVVMEEREGAFVLEGVGQMLTETFELEAGHYRIEVELVEVLDSDKRFNLGIMSRDGALVGSLGISYTNDLPTFASGSLRIREGGEFVAEIEGFSGAWKIVLSPV